MKITKEDRKQLKRVLENLGNKKTKEQVFYDLCFCICAPQCKFENNIKVIAELKKYGAGGCGFYKTENGCLTEAHLKILLRPVRFYNNKTKYLLETKKKFDFIYNQVITNRGLLDYEKRKWLVKNVKGLGMKASSHFLRNMGYVDLAIIDTHILKYMAEFEKYPDKALEIFRKQATSIAGYEDLEYYFKVLAEDNKLTMAELDALVWKNYSGTEWKDFKY